MYFNDLLNVLKPLKSALSINFQFQRIKYQLLIRFYELIIHYSLPYLDLSSYRHVLYRVYELSIYQCITNSR